MIATKIDKFVNFAIKNEGVNLHEKSFDFFSESDKSQKEFELVVPELLDLIKPKRDLVTNIVKEKTNYSIYPSADEFTLGLKIKEIGVTANNKKTYDWEDE